MDGAAGVPAELQGGRAQADRVLTAQEWLHKWETGAAAFHKEHGHPYGTAAPRPGQRGEGPGQQNPLKLLADLGHSIVGVDISEQALKEFFADQGLSYCEEPVPGIAGAKKLQVGFLEIVGKFDGVWDRGALVAVNPCDRPRYASLMISLMEKNSSYLLVTVLYDPNKHKGENFALFMFWFCINKNCLLEKVSDFSERHRRWGLDYFLEVLYILKFVA
uniref:Thiopurine S-methyltransferase n=1 Tax=Anas zonorhyncha TaxID=75864 RepID=A0A8B9VI43_9AVES